MTPDSYNSRGLALHRLQRHQEAVEAFDQAIAIDPGYANAYGNRGNSLIELRQHQRALESYDHVLLLAATCAEAYNGRATALHGLGQSPAAVESWNQAILSKPDYAQAYGNRGIVLFEMLEYQRALESLDHAVRLQPNYPYLGGLRLHLKRLLCDWKDIDEQTRQVESQIERGERASPPFMMLAITASPALQKKVAEIYVQDTCPPIPVTLPSHPRRDKIRLGYFSADFHNHAICYLMAELFERHDKSRFELLAFSFGRDQQDEMRTRVSAAMDHFLDVRFLSDEEVTRLSREREVDIAVDLMGFTQQARTGIFARRAAPIQVNYLGYPATMGASYIDYLIADRLLIPPESRQHYSEEIIYLPDTFQANSRNLPSETRCTRAQERLPEHAFVYCCFSNGYKIAPAMFDVWMRILQRVEGSVLWLFEGNPWVADNLRQEAARRGISGHRLIFARGLPLTEHLARLPLADLFLDTLPFNAGAMASPALWAGLPLLTCMGETFAGRMAASLLQAVRMPELVTTTSAEYEALAVEFALDRERYQELRQKLHRNRLTTPLFDAEVFTRNLEAAYLAMYERKMPP
jgi:predicted O-linked N-acetylglucosamine transferase (SPINDLY family)